MANGAETADQRRGSAFPTTNGTKTPFTNTILPSTSMLPSPGIWGAPRWGQRPITGSSRGTPIQDGDRCGRRGRILTVTADTSDNLPTGSGTLTASSEAEPPYQGSWPAQARNPSGNTSPNRSRIDAPSHDLKLKNPSFYPSTPPQMAIGHRGPAKASSGQAPDGINGLNPLSKHPETGLPYSAAIDGGDSKHGNLNLRNQVSQNGQYPHPTNHHPQGPHADYVDTRYGGFPSHSQRQSISGQSSSFTGPGSRGLGGASGRHREESGLPQLMSDMTLGSTTGVSNGISNLNGFQPPQSSFQLNPVSRPWENAASSTLGGFDTYGANRRDSGVDGSSPASAYPSHRSFAGTPQPAKNIWGSRPASRDHQTSVNSTTHGLIQGEYLPQNQLQQFATPHFVSQGFQQYGGGPYDNFQQQRLGYPGFVTGPVFRPGRDNDSLGHSPLLQEFRSHVKSGRLDKEKRWELRVRISYLC